MRSRDPRGVAWHVGVNVKAPQKEVGADEAPVEADGEGQIPAQLRFHACERQGEEGQGRGGSSGSEREGGEDGEKGGVRFRV